jgi:hypothetical protein
MDEEYRISEWMRQHSYALAWVAEHIGCSPEALSKALDTHCISHRLADAFYEHFGLRVISTGARPVRGDTGDIKDGALQVWRRAPRRRGIDLRAKAIDLERYRERIRRSPDERG